MKRGIVYVLAGTLVIAGMFVAYTQLLRGSREVAADLKTIGADTGDIMSSASYQRFALRRTAVASMRASLLGVARAESVAVAQIGRPEASNLSPYGFTNDPANLIYINIQRDRWVAQAKNIHTSMSCSLIALVVDTSATTWTYHPGEPICADWNAESTAVAAAALASSRATEAHATAVATKPSAAPEAQATPAPRPHHAWGPVNNTPPRMPYIVANTCEGEGCTNEGSWAACSTVVARTNKDVRSAPVFTLSPRERFTALTGDVHVESPGIVVFRYPTVNPVDPTNGDSMQFTPADTLYLLNSHGEGYQVWYFRGQILEGYQFWQDLPVDELPQHAADTVIQLRPAKTVLWVRVRNAAGKEGWITYDWYKIATGGYMDDVGRCLRTAKG